MLGPDIVGWYLHFSDPLVGLLSIEIIFIIILENGINLILFIEMVIVKMQNIWQFVFQLMHFLFCA